MSKRKQLTEYEKFIKMTQEEITWYERKLEDYAECDSVDDVLNKDRIKRRIAYLRLVLKYAGDRNE